MAILNWRNTQRENLPPQAQRVFERSTRSLILIHTHPSLHLPPMSYIVDLQENIEKKPAALITGMLTKCQSLKLQTDYFTRIPATVSGAVYTTRSYFVTTPTDRITKQCLSTSNQNYDYTQPLGCLINLQNFVRSHNDNSTIPSSYC